MKTIKINDSYFEELSHRLESIEKQLEELLKASPQDQEQFLTTNEVASLLKFTPRHIQNLRDRGLLPFSQIGRVIRYREQDVKDFLMNHYVESVKHGG